MEKKPIANLIDRLFGRVLTIQEYELEYKQYLNDKWSNARINGFDIRGHSKGTMV